MVPAPLKDTKLTELIKEYGATLDLEEYKVFQGNHSALYKLVSFRSQGDKTKRMVGGLFGTRNPSHFCPLQRVCLLTAINGSIIHGNDPADTKRQAAAKKRNLRAELATHR